MPRVAPIHNIKHSPPNPASATPHIAYVSNNDLTGRTPGSSFSIHTAQGLAEAGARTDLYLRGNTRKTNPHAIEQQFALTPQFQLHAPWAPKIGGSSLPYYLAVHLHLIRNPPDIIITRNLRFLPWALHFKQRRNTRVLFESHDFWYDPALRNEPLSPKQLRVAQLERKWLPRADQLICVSEPQAALYRTCLPHHNIVTARTGCRPVPAPQRTTFSFTLGYVGSFVPDKYPLDLVVRAVAQSRHKSIKLVCTGARTPREKQDILSLAQTHAIPDRIEVHEWRRGQDLATIRQRFDVTVAPLSTSFLNRIASPMKVLDALSLGTPVIASNLDGIAALVQDGTHCRLVENTPQAWTRAIDQIYNDFQAYARMAALCRQQAAKLHWTRRGHCILDAIRSAT